jgi:NAD(P)-dependent dehydrogenase (short-subunit alcohol dehydrogenase family)
MNEHHQRRLNVLRNHIQPQHQQQLSLNETGVLTTSAKIWYNKPRPRQIEAKGKAVLITGGSGGFGAALTIRLLEMGCVVFATDLRMSDLERELLSVKSNTDLYMFEMDVTKVDTIQRVFELVKGILQQRNLSLFGIVNNAGIGFPPGSKYVKSTVEQTENDMKVMFDVNMFGVHRVTRDFYPLLNKVGKDKLYSGDSSVVVNIASVAGTVGIPYMQFYCASKAAVINYSDSLRRELQVVGVRVACLEPGFTTTNIVKMPEVNVEAKNEFTSHITRRMKTVARMTKDSQPITVVINAIISAMFTTPNKEHNIVDQWKYKAPNVLLTYMPSYVVDKLFS